MPKQITFIKTLGVDEGLSQGMIFSILQDKEGFIWLATKDGLNRFDGYEFKVFKNTALPFSLKDNYVVDIAEDDQGNFWVLTQTKGLFLFDKRKETFHPIHLPNINSGQNPGWQHVNTQSHYLYINVYKQIYIYDISGLQVSNNEHAQHFIKFQSQVDVINHIKFSVNSQGAFGILNEVQDSLKFFQPNESRAYWKITPYTIADYRKHVSVKPNDTLFDFLVNNRLFVFRKNQLTIYDNSSSELIKAFHFPNAGFPNFQTYIEGIHELQFNYTNKKGIFKLNLNTMQLTFDQTQSHGDIGSQFRDRTKLIWVNTNGYGISLVNYEPVAFKNIYQPARCTGLPNNIYYDEVNGGVYLYEPEKHTSKQLLSPTQFRTFGNYYYFFLDKDSVLRLSHTIKPGSFYSYSLKTKKLEHTELPTQGIFKLMFDGETNRLWICEPSGTYSRLNEYDKTTKKIRRHFNFPVKENFEFLLYNVHHDGNGVYWIASEIGLIRFSPDRKEPDSIWKIFKHVDGKPMSLSETKILCVCPDPKEPKRYLWLGTEGQGISKFDMVNETCIHISEKDGLPNNVCYGILADKQGNLWISTNMGLSCYTPPSSGTQKGVFRNFTKEDGLPGNEFNRYEFYDAPNGELEFSGVNGGVRFLPEQVLKSKAAVPVYFISLYVNNKLVEPGDSSGILKEAITYCKRIQLNHRQNIFTIKFASIDYRNTKGKKYQYYLEGFTNEWTRPSERNEASFTNLNPGTYTFHLKGSNCDGIWNQQETILTIIILPAWYQTWWFKLICLFTIILGVYAFYRYKFQQLLKLQKLRNHIASDLHDELGSTLSSIALSTDLIENSLGKQEHEARLLLQQISNNVSQMMESMSDIVWTINTKNDSFKSIIRRMRSFASEMLEPKDIDFSFQIQQGIEDLKLNMQQRKNIYLVFKEAIHNAVKYSSADHITLNLFKENANLVLSIEDNGVGFDTTTSSNDLGGNGLYNIRKRAEELKGRVDIISKKGAGTKVVLYMKLK